jgi:CheY-like chemotaxis protein
MTSTGAAVRHVLVVDDDGALRHAIAALLDQAGYRTGQARDGREALSKLQQEAVDLLLLDIGLPGMSGLDVLAQIRSQAAPPPVIMMTADDTPETLLQSFRAQAQRFIRKPFPPRRIVEIVSDVLAAPALASLPIEVVSAVPEWVEIVAPCALEVGERVREFVMQLDATLPVDVRESVAQAFRELLTNAIEWGGHLDPQRTVRISCIRTRRMLLYRIADPGEGFDISGLAHAAISNPEHDPLAHDRVREAMGLRPGGLGLVMTRAFVDDVIYNEKRNEVVLVKYLG